MDPWYERKSNTSDKRKEKYGKNKKKNLEKNGQQWGLQNPLNIMLI